MKKIYISLFIVLITSITNAQNWLPQSSGTTRFLSSVFFVNADTGFIVGEGGTMLKTINGGSNWTKQTVPSDTSLNSIYFVNKNI
ncbi:MAG: YCF48-related protein, partial [bacterium]